MKPYILCVDDEPQLLESLRDSLRRRFQVVASTNGFEALRMLVDHSFPVVISDMRMPRIDGARFLTLAREHAPDTVRLLLTGQSTLNDAVAAVNEGEIFRFLIKPCATPDLITAIDAAIRQHETTTRERREAEQLVTGAVRGMVDMAAKVDPTAPKRADRVRKLAVELATALGLTYADEIGRACELVQIGAISLSPETRAHLNGGRPAGPGHAAELENLAAEALPLIEHMPRLEIERTVLTHVTRPFVPTRPGQAGTPIGARILRVALDYDILVLQDVPDHLRLDKLRAREGAYDPAILDAFAALLET